MQLSLSHVQNRAGARNNMFDGEATPREGLDTDREYKHDSVELDTDRSLAPQSGARSPFGGPGPSVRPVGGAGGALKSASSLAVPAPGGRRGSKPQSEDDDGGGDVRRSTSRGRGRAHSPLAAEESGDGDAPSPSAAPRMASVVARGAVGGRGLSGVGPPGGAALASDSRPGSSSFAPPRGLGGRAAARATDSIDDGELGADPDQLNVDSSR